MRQWVECCCCCCCLKWTWTVQTCCAKSYLTILHCSIRFSNFWPNFVQTFQHSKPRYVDTFDQTKRSNKPKISSKSKSMAAGADVIHKEERFPKVFSPTCEARSHLTFPKWRGDGMGQHLFIWYACDWWNAVRAFLQKWDFTLKTMHLGAKRCDRLPFPKHYKNWQVSLQPMRTRQSHLEALGNDGNRDHLI